MKIQTIEFAYRDGDSGVNVLVNKDTDKPAFFHVDSLRVTLEQIQRVYDDKVNG